MSASGTNVPCKFLAQLFGITQRRVQQLAQDGIIPKAERGLYPLLASVKGYVAFLQEVSKGTGGDNEEIIKNRARYEKARADQLEFEVALKKGMLVLADDVQDEVSAMVANFRARVLALPTSVASQGVGMSNRADLEQLVRTLVYEALNELSRFDPQQTKPKKNPQKRSRKR